jgi:uncharacterized protein (DUF885 family)
LADLASRRFRTVAERIIDAMLQAVPELATDLGDHRFDDRLTDLGSDGVQARAAMLSDALTALDDVDAAALPRTEQVDLEILRAAATRDLWLLTELREHERDPLVHLPGEALEPLLAREVGEPAARLRALAARMAAVPHRLAVARSVLHDMSRVHVETAIGQAREIVGRLGDEVDDLLTREPTFRAEVAPARNAAVEALAEHLRWLAAQLPNSDGDPRLGGELFAAKLWYALDTETVPDSLLTRAESDLQAVEEAIAELASQIAGSPPRAGQVREVLDRLAAEAPVTDATVLPLCEQALEVTAARVRELDLVSVPEDPILVVGIPPARRGVTIGRCDPPGPLEPPGPGDCPLPTFFAVSPAPGDWTPQRVASFYREYNGHLLRDLIVHEAMPGHGLQLAHAKRFGGGTRVRAANRSGPFVEGWAVYAESLLADVGLGLGSQVDAALRMQQLKMRLRSIINVILDVRVHTRGMTQDEAMALMTVRGHQEESEAVGKWRRALLTSTQLSTYDVGFHEMRDVVQRLAVARPGASQRQLHDEVLSHGSPPPRHLLSLLGLP